MSDSETSRRSQGRLALVEAATESLFETGIAESSLESTAVALGVSCATLLEHFESLDQLIIEVFEGLLARSVELANARTDTFAMPTEQLLRSNWQLLCQPEEQGQFLLLFEIVALNAREPGRFEAQTKRLVDHILVPIEKNLHHNGWKPEESRQLATMMLAVFRGLHLDLVMTGDQYRVDQAMYRFIDMVTASHGEIKTRL